MNFTEIASRITGFSIPIFGISWNPSVPEVTVARQLITFLEDRRVLFNDYELESPEYCVQSIIKIREFLTDVLKGLDDGSALSEHIRPMRAACRNFLDVVQDGRRPRLIIDIGHRSGPESWTFFTALGKLRGDLGLRICAIAIMHGLEVEDALARILPSEA